MSLDHLGQAIIDALESGVSAKEILIMLQAALVQQEAEQRRLPEVPANSQHLIYSELPDGMIDLPTAAGKYDVPKTNLQSWIYRGRLHSYGCLRRSGPGGGSHIVHEGALRAELAKAALRGRRLSKHPDLVTLYCPNCETVWTKRSQCPN